MSYIIAPSNRKGMFDKPTMAVNISGAMSTKVALVVADHLASTTAWAEAGSLTFSVIKAVLHDHGEPVGPVVSQRIVHSDAYTVGQWIGQYAKGSAAHAETCALASVTKRMAGKR